MMIADPMSTFGVPTDTNPSFKRAQGRPARGDTEVGKQKIVEGMREALRSLGNTNVIRKDVASFAGVTPALVTYYFPERSELIRDATLPVVETLVINVKDCLSAFGSARQQILGAVNVLLECYAHDAVIIELFEAQKTTILGTECPDLLNELEIAITTFFERWIDNTASTYDAKFLQKAMIGMCKNVARLSRNNESKRSDVADMVCSMLLGSEPDAEAMQVSNPARVAEMVC